MELGQTTATTVVTYILLHKKLTNNQTGSTTGVIFIIYNLGQIAAFPLCGLLADGYGRRICIFIGCLIVWIGTAVQASANGKKNSRNLICEASCKGHKKIMLCVPDRK